MNIREIPVMGRDKLIECIYELEKEIKKEIEKRVELEIMGRGDLMKHIYKAEDKIIELEKKIEKWCGEHCSINIVKSWASLNKEEVCKNCPLFKND